MTDTILSYPGFSRPNTHKDTATPLQRTYTSVACMLFVRIWVALRYLVQYFNCSKVSTNSVFINTYLLYYYTQDTYTRYFKGSLKWLVYILCCLYT